MKQGSGRNVYEPKMEPVPHAVDEKAVSVIGQAVVYVKPNLEDGRGFKAPMNVSQSAGKSGSQGRH